MVTKKTRRRNENILLKHQKGMSYRAIGKMFKLSPTQVMNIIHMLKELGLGNEQEHTE